MSDEKKIEILPINETILIVQDECPNAIAKKFAKNTMATVLKKGKKGLIDSVSFMLSNMSEWEGDRAKQVKESLKNYLTNTESNDDKSD